MVDLAITGRCPSGHRPRRYPATDRSVRSGDVAGGSIRPRGRARMLARPARPGRGSGRTLNPRWGRAVMRASPRRRFSILCSSVRMLVHCALLLLGSRTFLPRAWAIHIAAGPLAFLVVLLSIQLLMSFYEWAFHRYVLHSVTTT